MECSYVPLGRRFIEVVVLTSPTMARQEDGKWRNFDHHRGTHPVVVMNLERLNAGDR